MGVPGPSSRGTSAISRFLVEHQDHDAGFDVGREAGSGTGHLRVVCLGCGESVDYRTTETGPEVRARLGSQRSSRQGQERLPKQPAAHSQAAGRSGRPPLAAIAIGIVILGLVLIGILLLAGGGSNDSMGTRSTTPTSAPATVATQPTAPATAPPAKPEPRPPRLHAATYDDRFTIGVPGRWRSERRGAETVLLGPGGTPEIDIYYAINQRGMADLGRSAVRFLEDRHPAGHVTEPVPTSVADLRALRVQATYPDGSESALVLTSGAYAYLLVTRIARNDEPYRVRQATAARKSFRPL